MLLCASTYESHDKYLTSCKLIERDDEHHGYAMLEPLRAFAASLHVNMLS